MNPFLVYLMFQSENISVALLVLATAMLIGFGLMAVENNSNTVKKRRRWGISCIVMFIISALIPSPKTTAAMIVIPKMTSPAALNTLSAESQELYTLAKKALTKLAEDGNDTNKR